MLPYLRFPLGTVVERRVNRRSRVDLYRRLQPINTRSQFRRLVSSFQRSSSLPRIPHSTGTSLAAPVGLTAFASPLSTTTAYSS
jgi:hypothetical protein